MTKVESLIKESPVSDLRGVRAMLELTRNSPDLDEEGRERRLLMTEEDQYIQYLRESGVDAEEIARIEQRLSGRISQVNANNIRENYFVPQSPPISDYSRELSASLNPVKG